MKKVYINLIALIALIAIFAAFTLFSCDTESTGKGAASFYLTDGPLEANTVSAVVITFSKVEVSGPGGWTTVKEYDSAQSINLLDLQNGTTFFIDEAELTGGAYGQVRLGLLDNVDESNPQNSYIEFDGGARAALKTPSGSQSGYKIIGGFTIPDGGVTSVTIDFDVRKSVVETGAGKYILKPTLRLVENANVAVINGTITTDTTASLVVYAYDNDTYTNEEAISNADGLLFANAITSAKIDEAGTFTLAFLTSGTYDLYLASYDEEGELINSGAIDADIVLSGGNNISIEIDLTE